MRRFTNILFVHDPESKATSALERAVLLAKSNKAQLTALSVIDELPRTLPNLENTFIELREKQLRALIKQSGGQGLDVKIRVLTGRPFLQIIQEVLRNRHDLIVKGAKGRSRISNILFGSTDMHLLRKCPCPVWIIKPSKRKQHSRILAAVDPYQEGTDVSELNHLILNLATSLARLENSELHIVHAWNLGSEAFLRSSRTRVPKSLVDREVREIRKTHKKLLGDLLDQYDFSDINTKVHFLKGEPEKVIPTLADKKRVELIVMGTVVRTGIPGLLIGNTAEKILTKVNCSVLALKPKSFVTPVAD